MMSNTLRLPVKVQHHATFFRLMAAYSKQPSKLNEDLLDFLEKRSAGDQTRIVKDLYKTIIDECDCGTCFNTFARNSRTPWRSLRHGHFTNCEHGKVQIKKCAIKNIRLFGYVYKKSTIFPSKPEPKKKDVGNHGKIRKKRRSKPKPPIEKEPEKEPNWAESETEIEESKIDKMGAASPVNEESVTSSWNEKQLANLDKYLKTQKGLHVTEENYREYLTSQSPKGNREVSESNSTSRTSKRDFKANERNWPRSTPHRALSDVPPEYFN